MPLENGERKINIYFQHGWGFDAGCWQDIGLDDQQRCRSFFAERGYFGLEAIGDVKSVSGHTVTICHSLGLHLIAPQQLRRTDLLVVMAGFKFFHGEEEVDGRFSRRHVRRMLTDLQKNPILLLNKFYHDCSFSGSRSRLSTINGHLLYDDLLLLDTHRLDLSKLSHIPQVLILHGNKDRIVPLSRGLFLSASLENATFNEIDGAGHGLIFSHWKQCWQIIAAAINELG